MSKLSMETSAPARKVVGATAGAGIGDVVASVLINLIEIRFAVDLSTELETLITAVLVALIAFTGGYFTPPAYRDQIVIRSAPRGAGGAL